VIERTVCFVKIPLFQLNSAQSCPTTLKVAMIEVIRYINEKKS
jgi:hypothetical protein